MSSQRNSQTPRVPKVRQSCDTCQTSKIRCGQERPSCRRCTKYNIECVYSASRRAGRPRPKRTVDSTTPAPPSPTQSQSSQHQQTLLPTPTETSPSQDGRRPLASPPRETTLTAVEATVRSGTQDADLGRRQYHDPSPDGSQPDSSRNQETSIFAENDSQTSNHYHPVNGDSNRGQAQDSISNGSNDYNDDINVINNGQTSHFSQDLEMDQTTNLFSDLDPSQYPDFFFPDNALINDQMDFEVLMTPLRDSAPLEMHAFPQASLAVVQGCTSITKVPQGCQCTATLLQHLGELSVTDTCVGSGRDDGAFFASAVQRSRVLLDHCFVVFSCPSCSTRMSSALVLCQAMDELSVMLGMGTLWIEGSGSCEQDRCSLLSNLAKDELPMRCGSYAVRGLDRQILLRTLMTNRLSEMQRAVGKLCEAVALLSSASCRATCAGMATELEKRISSKVEMFRAAGAAPVPP